MVSIKLLLAVIFAISAVFLIISNILTTNLDKPAQVSLDFLPDIPLKTVEHDRIIAIGDLHGDYQAFLDILSFTS